MHPEINLLEQSREPTTNSTDIMKLSPEIDLGHIGGRQVVTPLSQLSSFVKVVTNLYLPSYNYIFNILYWVLLPTCLPLGSKQSKNSVEPNFIKMRFKLNSKIIITVFSFCSRSSCSLQGMCQMSKGKEA